MVQMIAGSTAAEARDQIAAWLEYRARRIRSGADNHGRRGTPEMVEDLAKELRAIPTQAEMVNRMAASAAEKIG